MIGIDNLLLARASGRTRAKLAAVGVARAVGAGERIAEADAPETSVHFPLGAVIGVTAVAGDAECSLAAIGNDGFSGRSLLLGLAISRRRLIVEAPGAILDVPAPAVAEALAGDPAFAQAASAFVRSLAQDEARAVACTALHTVRRRLARRLYDLWERSGRPATLPIARSAFARFCATDPRTAARALRELHATGALTPLGAVIAIDDPDALRAAACRCDDDGVAGRGVRTA